VVARSGRLAQLEAHGLVDIASKKTMSKDSLFRIASMTKPITGVAILRLIEEGRVRLTDPVSRFIPEFRGMKVAVPQDRPAGSFYTIPANREITIQDLLVHVSGLVGGGAGFETLGRVVEIVSGQTLDQFLRQRIFDPLGMKDTTFHPGWSQLARIATIYHRANNAMTKIATPDWLNGAYLTGAGGLLSDAEDYLQFCQMLANGGQWNGKRLLGPRTVDLMSSIFAPDTLPGRTKGRGFGLSVEVISDAVAANTRISNGSYGWDGSFGTHFWVDPKEKMIGILMIHTDNSVGALNGEFENAVMQAVIE